MSPLRLVAARVRALALLAAALAGWSAGSSAAATGDDALADAAKLYEKRESREATRRSLMERLFPTAVESGEWHSLGHFPYAGHRRRDLAPAREPEAELLQLRAGDAAPDFARTFAGKDGTVAEWRSLGRGVDRRLDLRRFGDGRDDFAVDYVHGTLIAKESGTLEAHVGSDDGLRLWCNGKLLVDKDVPRSLEPPFDLVKLPLVAGVNHVVAKVANGVADFAFELDTRPELAPELDSWLAWRLDTDFPRSRERLYWRELTVRVPPSLTVEVGGLDFFADPRPLPAAAAAPREDREGVPPSMPMRVVVATRRGDVFLVDGAFAEPPIAATFTRFASGLHEPLGAAARIVDGRLEVWCVQRGELTRMVDQDGDDRADLFDDVCDAWGVSGNYHEFAFGPKFDHAGNAWVTLNVAFCGGLGKAEVPYRGWAAYVTPERRFVPVCTGARSPNGIGAISSGEVFYVDNQGDWVETNVLKRLAPGEFLGHPAGLRWSADVERDAAGAIVMPAVSPPVVWFPYGKLGQSTADVVPQDAGGRFGPFDGQLLCGDQTQARLVRVDLEKVGERFQGACFPLLEGLDSGVNRLAFAADGSLLVGETDRGWGSVGRFRQGLERVTWLGRTPCELRRMRIESDGFRLEFTRPVDPATAADPASYKLSSFGYEHHAEYGCPELDPQPHAILSAEPLDSTTVRLRVDRLRAGHVHELRLDGVRSSDYADAAEPAGSPLLHSIAWYTVVTIPEATAASQ
jgi:hypothetical protein